MRALAGGRALAGLASLAVGLLAARTVAGSPHETFIDVETEQDLYDAISSRLISGETFERLRALLAQGVSLDGASRDELYELPNLTYAEVDAILALRVQRGSLGDGAALVQAGILSQRQLDAIAPFLAGAARSGRGWAGGWLLPSDRWAAWAQLATRRAPREAGVPSVALRWRVAAPGGLVAGGAVALTRLRLADVGFEPNRQELVASAPRPRVELPKLYARWDRPALTVIAGSYRAGFGQRVTFDDTGAAGPDGFVEDDELTVEGGLVQACKEVAAERASECAADDRKVTPDVRWAEGALGAALAVRRVAPAQGQLAVQLWGSLAPRSMASYEVVSERRCPDPRREDLVACAPPLVLRRPAGSVLSPTTRYAGPRLPAVLSERLLGAHLGYVQPRRLRLGLTGYTSRLHNLVSGAALAPRPGSRWPAGRFGALGVEAAGSVRGAELASEVARSFAPGTARVRWHRALGGVVRATWARAQRELELTGRYYGAAFINPFARPVAADDELDGQRARDEAGVRARYSRWSARWGLRAAVDGWTGTLAPVPRLAAQLRGQWQPSVRWSVAGQLTYDDKDLRQGGAQQCFEGSDGTDAEGSPRGCRGARVGSAIKLVRWAPALELAAQVNHDLIDDGAPGRSRRRHAGAAWVMARVHTEAGVAVRASARLRQASLADGASAAWTSTGALELRWPLRTADLVRVRLDATLELRAPGAAAASGAALAPDPDSDLGGRPLWASLWVSYDLAY